MSAGTRGTGPPGSRLRCLYAGGDRVYSPLAVAYPARQGMTMTVCLRWVAGVACGLLVGIGAAPAAPTAGLDYWHTLLTRAAK